MGASYPVVNLKVFQEGGKNPFKDGSDGTFNPPYMVGQMIFVEDTGKIYMDFHGKRTCYSGGSSSADSSASVLSTTAINYIGIVTTEDWDAKSIPEIKNKDTYSPKANDMVVYGVKEYLYRMGDDGLLGWYEIGDEDAEGGGNELCWEDGTEDS